MNGELEGIMSSEVPALPALEMPHALEEGEEKDQVPTAGRRISRPTICVVRVLACGLNSRRSPDIGIMGKGRPFHSGFMNRATVRMS